jgi:hypothetical protein
MRKCVVCQSDYQESNQTQKYCDRLCKRAAYLKLTRVKYLEQRQERENQFTEELKKTGEAGYGTCVIFRDDGGYNRQYLTRTRTWTVNRREAARFLGVREAEQVAKKYCVVFVGGPTVSHPSCDILSFRFPDQFNRWAGEDGDAIDADDPSPTERLICADFESVVPQLKARALLREGHRDKPDVGPQDFIRS